ncbi:BTAD domain-containing putative transcriptional regulator [Kribbella sp. HUAS MG21]|uniref:BTAD domain-containing putative transcriptional regulator n=1 Tax=Kribbella sp. HUAS MG21 TaxID=3160966 RepID=A0AAU7T7C7_9ACTN
MRPESDLRILLLGPLEVRRSGELVPIPAGGRRTVLAALALAGGEVVDVDTLTDLLWSGNLPENPRSAVQQIVVRLRRSLGAATVRTGPGGYYLDIERGQVDALRAEDLIRRAESTDSEAKALQQAAGLWRGAALGGVDSDALVRQHATRLSELRLVTQERLFDLDLRTGDVAAWIAPLQELTRVHPLRESLRERLILALARSGRRAEALAEYESARALTVESLGTEPSVRLRAVHLELLGEDEVVTAAAHRPVPRQLPAPPPHFAGRTADLAHLDELWRAGERTIVLHGPGGVGKSALVLHWAEHLKSQCADGQIFVDLRGYGPDQPVLPDAALGMMLRAIGVADRSLPPTTTERSALWRTQTADRSLLVVLDNVRDADQLRPLLPGPGCTTIVTSRNNLRGFAVRDGAARHLVDTLSMDDSVAVLATALGRKVVDAEPEAVRELAELCGQLPLALLVGAQVVADDQGASIATAAARLRSHQHRLDVLADTFDPAADPRQVISWSYTALDADSRWAFRTLGLHPAPVIEIRAAAALLGRSLPATRHLLDRLVAVHLLQVVDTEYYGFHDLIAVYAAELAEPDDDALRRLAEWYVATLHAARSTAYANPALKPATEPPAPVSPRVLEGLRGATEWYLRSEQAIVEIVRVADGRGWHELAWQLAALLGDFQSSHAHSAQQAVTSEIARSAAAALGDPDKQALAHFLSGVASNVGGDPAAALGWHEQGLALADQAGNRRLMASILAAMGTAHQALGDPMAARTTSERSVRIARGLTEHPLRLAHSLLNLSSIEADSEEWCEAAQEHLREAIELYRAQGARFHLGLAFANLANAAMVAGQPSEAIEYAAEAIRQVEELGDGLVRPTALRARGQALLALGDPDGAAVAWEQALRQIRFTEPQRAAVLEQDLAELTARRPR